MNDRTKSKVDTKTETEALKDGELGMKSWNRSTAISAKTITTLLQLQQ